MTSPFWIPAFSAGVPSSTEATLAYQVNERSKVKVENVVLTGNKDVPANELIGKMRNRKRGFLFLVDASDGWSVVKPATGAPVMATGGALSMSAAKAPAVSAVRAQSLT